MKKVKVWECKIIVPEDAELPQGFDNPPRSAAIAAVGEAGIEVLGCSSGWGGHLTKGEREAFESQLSHDPLQVYYAGTIDSTDGTAH